MSKFFDIQEMLEFAIRIEENGEYFYKQMAAKIQDNSIKEMFNMLAAEEIKHRKIFENMLSSLYKYIPSESYLGEYFNYLRSYANDYIFTEDKKPEIVVKKINSAKEALDFAIGIELDSVLYYLEMKNLVSKEQINLVDNIIEEERKHYLKLSQLKKELLNP